MNVERGSLNTREKVELFNICLRKLYKVCSEEFHRNNYDPSSWISHCELFLEHNPCDKQGITLHLTRSECIVKGSFCVYCRYSAFSVLRENRFQIQITVAAFFFQPFNSGTLSPVLTFFQVQQILKWRKAALCR